MNAGTTSTALVRTGTPATEITLDECGGCGTWTADVAAGRRRGCRTVKRRIELTYPDFADLPFGTGLHFTNWPGRSSVPVTYVNSHQGNVLLPSGQIIAAFPDELSWEPRAGLEVREVNS